MPNTHTQHASRALESRWRRDLACLSLATVEPAACLPCKLARYSYSHSCNISNQPVPPGHSYPAHLPKP
eukprot:scaffold666274_cov66-Prasinocladus_malaysianus.AAC.1